MFYRLKERIPIAKNKKFLQSLYNTKNAEETVGAFQVTKQSYEEKFGEPYEDVKVKPTEELGTLACCSLCFPQSPQLMILNQMSKMI